MKILKIKLVNFQSYKNEEFQMNDVMVILRENGAGKSAFLKALNFALCGEGCDDGEIMQGEKEMSVSILFENGLTVERKRKKRGQDDCPPHGIRKDQEEYQGCGQCRDCEDVQYRDVIHQGDRVFQGTF